MIKETVSLNNKRLSLTVTNNKISAVLRSNTTKSGIRLYDNDCLGIASAIGAYDDNELTNRAKHMLNFKLPYPCAPERDKQMSLTLSDILTATEDEFVDMAERVLAVLSEKFPKFAYTGRFGLFETCDSLVNDQGLSLVQKDRMTQFSLRYKHKDSKNLMDGGGLFLARKLCFDTILEQMTDTCAAYDEKVDFSEQGEMIPVVTTSHWSYLIKFMKDLDADTFANNASMFSGKTGQKLFGDDFNLINNMCAKSTFGRFFDGEGITHPNNTYHYIENGVLKSPLTTKRTAKQYDLPISGSAGLTYDSAPDTSWQMAAARGGKTLKELLAGRKAILAISAGGGDYTPQGEFASPIQTAYMFDGEKLLGRLPQLSMSSHINDMFGKDFIGVSKDGPFEGSHESYMVLNMNVKKIDGWM